eukprot:4398264-Lingulodinium_polyedra.AAC.1
MAPCAAASTCAHGPRTPASPSESAIPLAASPPRAGWVGTSARACPAVGATNGASANGSPAGACARPLCLLAPNSMSR